MKITFTNPRRKAEIDNWPLGGSKRGLCTFEVHTDAKKGERISRITTGKPKFTTYAQKAAIVDGSNGRTYLLKLNLGGSVNVMQSDMQHDATEDELGCRAYVYAGGASDELYNTLKGIIESAQ